jgi:hypothetical protein
VWRRRASWLERWRGRIAPSVSIVQLKDVASDRHEPTLLRGFRFLIWRSNEELFQPLDKVDRRAVARTRTEGPSRLSTGKVLLAGGSVRGSAPYSKMRILCAEDSMGATNDRMWKTSSGGSCRRAGAGQRSSAGRAMRKRHRACRRVSPASISLRASACLSSPSSTFHSSHAPPPSSQLRKSSKRHRWKLCAIVVRMSCATPA